MKTLILIFTIFSFSYSSTYTFLVNKYDKELELESKIILNIAKSLIDKKIILFIPRITKAEKDIYSNLFTIGNSCEDSNFIFVKRYIKNNKLCENKSKLLFTNNYQKLINNNEYFGAFFWSKSRPNIVFIKDRLIQKNISLPKSYNQFVEEL